MSAELDAIWNPPVVLSTTLLAVRNAVLVAGERRCPEKHQSPYKETFRGALSFYIYHRTGEILLWGVHVVSKFYMFFGMGGLRDKPRSAIFSNLSTPRMGKKSCEILNA